MSDSNGYEGGQLSLPGFATADELQAEINRLKKNVADAMAEIGKPKLQALKPGTTWDTYTGIYTIPTDGFVWTTGGAVQSSNGQLSFDTNMLDKPVKCECGSSAVGSPKHSDYCPLYLLQES